MASLSLPTSTKPLPFPKNPIKSPKSTQISRTHTTKSLKNLNSSQNLSNSYLHQLSSLCKQGLLHDAFSLLNQMESDDLPIGPEMYGELLQGCVYERALSEGRQIHARIIKNGAFFYKNEYIGTKILIFYAKCDCLETAEGLFLRQRRPNVFSWAAMIGLHSRHGLNEKALLGFCKMIELGAFPDNFVVPNALKACSALEWIGFGRGIHGYVLKLGFGSCVYVLSSLVDFYGKCGVLDDAEKVFEEMPERNVVTWNSMLVGCVQNGLNEEALEVFYDMRIDGVEPTRVSIASFLTASANLEALDEGRQGHGTAVLYGLELDNILGTSIINFYCKVGLVEDAENIFYLMVDRDTVTWNLLISGYLLEGQIETALHACHQMRKENLMFDSVTLASILSACTFADNIELGRIGHAYCIRNNLESDLAVASSTIDLYASCGKLEYAQKVFNFSTSKNLDLWNALISAYALHGLSGEALKLFYQMQLEGVPPNMISWNSVILGFLRNGQVKEAQDVLSEMQMNGLNPNLYTWTIFMFGLVQNGYDCEAIKFFVQMQSTGLRPAPTIIVGVLLACSNTLCLSYGRAVHGHVMRRGLLSSLSIATSLVDMYAKCGSIKLARMVFENVSDKVLPVYNAMICGLSLHGQGKEALALYEHMQGQEIEPDDATFSGLLLACSHAGLVDVGLKVFTEMVCKHRMTPQKEDYGCLVTLLARCGNFKEAVKVALAMPLGADSRILGSLLSACKENQETDLGEYISSCLLEAEPTHSVNYTTLSCAYAASAKWQRDSTLRALVKDIGLRNPGCTWIQIRHELHAFVVGDKSQPQIDTISEALLCLHRQIESVGCAPITVNSGLMDSRQETLCSL